MVASRDLSTPSTPNPAARLDMERICGGIFCRVAARNGRTVDAVLAAELLGFVSAESPWLSAEIPGFAEALRWPAAQQTLPRG